MRKALLLFVAGWAFLIACVSALVLNPAGDSPASTGGSALAVLAAVNEKEGQGDLLCGPAGGTSTAGASLAAIAAGRAGFTGADLVTAVAVAGAESGWRPDAVNVNTNGSRDFGLWQINSVHAVILASGDWRDPYDNARMAHRVWAEAGGSWSPWVTFNTGAYRAHLSTAQAAVAGAGAVAVQPCTGGDGGGGPLGPDQITEWTRLMRDDIHSRFSGVVGCYRPGTWGEHRLGRACDFMASTAQGNAIAAYAQQNSQRLHVMYIIWRQHVWSPARADEGWRLMEDRGSPTQNHMDHVHVSVCADTACRL